MWDYSVSRLPQRSKKHTLGLTSLGHIKMARDSAGHVTIQPTFSAQMTKFGRCSPTPRRTNLLRRGSVWPSVAGILLAGLISFSEIEINIQKITKIYNIHRKSNNSCKDMK
jgi:hypothetical protein